MKFLRGGLVRTIVLAVITCSTILFSTVVCLINMGWQLPLLLVSIVPYGGGAIEAQMSAFSVPLRGADRTQLNKGRLLADAALRDEPLSVDAVRTLAIIAATEGQDLQSSRLLAYAERISRRDLPTELILIEMAVNSGDIDGALRHYDRALRVSPETTQFLLTVLDKAAATPAVQGRLIALLRQRPPWRPWFLSGMAFDPSASASALANIVVQLRLDLHDQHDRQALERTLARLVTDRQFGRAYQLYIHAMPSGAAFLRNGDFEAEPLLPPFDWALVQTAGVSGIREKVSAAGGYALSIVTDDGQSGEVARQLLVLAPGDYTLSLAAGGVSENPDDRPLVRIECPGANLPLTHIVLPASAQRKVSVTSFTVPQGTCPAQWLIVAAAGGMDKSIDTPWLDSFVIRRK